MTFKKNGQANLFLFVFETGLNSLNTFHIKGR